MIGDAWRKAPPPVSPAVEALFAYERIIVEKSEMLRARLLARARASLRGVVVAELAPRRAPLPLRRWLLAAAAGVVLMAGAAAAFQLVRQPVPAPLEGGRTSPHVRLGPRSPAPGLAPSSAPMIAPVPGESAESPVAKASVVRYRASLRGKNESVNEEVRLLDRAWRFAARGSYNSVLDIARDHERAYPDGRLAEEREVLRVKALVGLGRGAEARQTAVKLRRQFPRSVLLPKIDDMLKSLE